MRPVPSMRGKKGNAIVCGRKFCAGCGHWRHACDFSANNRAPLKLAGRCRVCTNRYIAERRDGPWGDLRREYQRIWSHGRARAAGIPERRLQRPAPADPAHSHNGGGYLHRRVDTAPLVPYLEAYLRAWAATHPHNVNGHRGIEALAAAAVVPERHINGILRLEHKRTHYAVADRLAVAIGLTPTLIYPDEW